MEIMLLILFVISVIQGVHSIQLEKRIVELEKSHEIPSFKDIMKNGISETYSPGAACHQPNEEIDG